MLGFVIAIAVILSQPANQGLRQDIHVRCYTTTQQLDGQVTTYWVVEIQNDGLEDLPIVYAEGRPTIVWPQTMVTPGTSRIEEAFYPGLYPLTDAQRAARVLSLVFEVFPPKGELRPYNTSGGVNLRFATVPAKSFILVRYEVDARLCPPYDFRALAKLGGDRMGISSNKVGIQVSD